MQKIGIAFFWSVVLAGLAGLAISPLMVLFDLPWWLSSAGLVGLTVLQAWVQSRDLLARALGKRDNPQLIVGNRDIPISAGGLAMRFESALAGRKRDTVAMEGDISIMTATGLLITDDRVRQFIRWAWQRQSRGDHGLSRDYWTKDHRPAWERSEYDAMIYVLVGGGYVEGRRAGRAGRLNADYGQIIAGLKRG